MSQCRIKHASQVLESIIMRFRTELKASFTPSLKASPKLPLPAAPRLGIAIVDAQPSREPEYPAKREAWRPASLRKSRQGMPVKRLEMGLEVLTATAGTTITYRVHQYHSSISRELGVFRGSDCLSPGSFRLGWTYASSRVWSLVASGNGA